MLYKAISDVIETLDVSTITQERKILLNELLEYIKVHVNRHTSIRLNFICTHNSRRSHLAQIWAQTLAAYYNVKQVTTYSGGTEATAMFSKVAETLVHQGFAIKTLAEQNNPVYSIKYANNESAIIGFSKTYDDDFNPTSHFAAIMTCTSADAGCPFVAGSDKRIAIPYQDPKASDGTPQQTAIYRERSLQIATEMKYVFSSL